MNKEVIKYDKIKEIREKIRTLSLNLGDLVSVLDNELVDEKDQEKLDQIPQELGNLIKNYGNY